jgi:hypothetical protein
MMPKSLWVRLQPDEVRKAEALPTGIAAFALPCGSGFSLTIGEPR